MSDRRCWGIFRERAHSPGREADDAEILRLTAKQLEASGFEIRLKSPDEVADVDERRPPSVFLMCERIEILRRLQDWEAAGVRLVNTPRAVLNTYRERLLDRWRRARIPFPPSRVVPTGSRPAPRPGLVWVKRGDVHNTQDGDVVLARDTEVVREALAGLARRGIGRAVLQRHAEGDLLKFYGIGATTWPDGRLPWFRCFYHRDQELQGYPFDPEELADLTRRAASALGLEVFGGDAIVTPRGRLTLIDLNAWPSFALYRDEAAAQIAAYLALRFEGR